MRRRACALLATALLAGCDALPGRPDPADRWLPPVALLDPATLYAENCAGCHGPDGRGGAALALADPVYLAIVPDRGLRAVVANGMPGTEMPAFAVGAGGTLTDAQVDAVVRGLRARARPDALGSAAAPPWAGAPGDATAGATVFADACARCHGADGHGGTGAGSIVDGAFLALVSDQYLRTLVIAGRPDLGHPDWRQARPGRPLTAAEVADVVAWLAARRPAFPGGGPATAARVPARPGDPS